MQRTYRQSSIMSEYIHTLWVSQTHLNTLAQTYIHKNAHISILRYGCTFAGARDPSHPMADRVAQEQQRPAGQRAAVNLRKQADGLQKMESPETSDVTVVVRLLPLQAIRPGLLRLAMRLWSYVMMA
jgi:hypothetical protein